MASGAGSGSSRRGGRTGADRLAHDSAEDAKKNEFRPHRREYWKLPPKENAAFVAAMEGVLGVYGLAYDPLYPVVCMDESSRQLIGEVSAPIPAAPGRPVRIDHKYVRHGVAQIFLEVEPLAGRRHVSVTEQRTAMDWARWIKGVHDGPRAGEGRSAVVRAL